MRFDALFTFIYSPREGTPAAKMPDPIPKEEKAANFQRLVDLQDQISEEKHAAYVGKTVRCLVDGRSDDPRASPPAPPATGWCTSPGTRPSSAPYLNLKITGASTWALFGELAE